MVDNSDKADEQMPEVETEELRPRHKPVEVAAEVIDGPPEVRPADPEPKRIGRPAGAKDVQKRKTAVRAKRTIVVVERPIDPPVAQVEAYLPPPQQMPEQPSPRSLMREAHSMIMQAHHGRSEARRAHFQDNVMRCTSDFRF